MIGPIQGDSVVLRSFFRLASVLPPPLLYHHVPSRLCISLRASASFELFLSLGMSVLKGRLPISAGCLSPCCGDCFKVTRV